MPLVPPALDSYLGMPGYLFTWFIFISGLSLFSYVIYKRFRLLRSGQPDPRFSRLRERAWGLLTFGIFQKRQPRYPVAGIIHIMIFSGFIVLGLRSIELVAQGLNLPFVETLMEGTFGAFYGTLKDLFELMVLIACAWAVLRRAVMKPSRYEGSHEFEAYLVLGLIASLMITDMFYEGSGLLFSRSEAGWLPAGRLAAFALPTAGRAALNTVHQLSYWLHLLIFFSFLNLLPLSKHFHIITALPNVFFRKLSKGSLKPARWGAEDMENLEAIGVEKLEDFTWKHILDFFTCTECGRCSDMCPANAVGRPLSPKMLTIKLRDRAYEAYPLFGRRRREGPENDEKPMVGGLISSEEIWSCTTCGACEEECPVFIEYIDKIIDMRRHLIETAEGPKAFNQVLMQVEKTGNPFGKPAAKRADWLKETDAGPVKLLKEGDEVDVLYFVDSYGSYDPKVQEIAAAVVKALQLAEVNFGILGPLERDSGHQVRRMGEEGLFQFLVEENMETLKGIRFKKIITTDPHAFNTLKNDYPADFEVCHYAPFILSLMESGRLKPVKRLEGGEVYTYHDPCYLGRHNGVYEPPRRILQSLPGLKMVEMARYRDRSFCCGGGDVILWHEIEQEDMRMAEKRIQMAREVGADVIVTACPFCLIHFEDAIKTAELDKEMRVVDLMVLTLSTL
jgi:Fe-S oxidoreductase